MSHASRAESRALSLYKGPASMPAAKYFRKGNIIDDTTGNVLFTGVMKLKDGTVVPSISAAKRHVRTALRPKYGELRTV